MVQLYDRNRLSSWLCTWLACRALGRPLPGPPLCRDSCPLDCSRWELRRNGDGPYYVCRECGRFIGYAARAHQRKGKR